MSPSAAHQKPTRAGLWQLILLLGVMAVIYVSAISSHNWILVGFLTLILLGSSVVGLRSNSTQFHFEVGNAETHRFLFRFNKFWGTVDIDVDDEPVIRDMRLFSKSLTKQYIVGVGTAERHEIRIEKDRAAAFAGVRRQPLRAYVDDVLIAEAVA